MDKTEILFHIIALLLGLVIYFFEYKPVPKNVKKEDLWKYGVFNGIIGDSIVVVAAIGILFSDPVTDTLCRVSDFWAIVLIIILIAAPFLLLWMVKLLKKKVVHNREARRKIA
ncbi:MAG: hypothetical protein IJ789_01330 [Bacteroidales bacterium]|nr:hypothetical protein [Bacteroidales bacterium]